MEIFTVSFFGHRRIDRFSEVRESAEQVIQDLVRTKDYVDFLVGREGDFDYLISSSIVHMKRHTYADNCSHVCVLPYHKAVIDRIMDEEYYDEIVICEESSRSHPKRAIQIRNRSMVERSDLVIFFVEHPHGGAYETLKYAKKLGKTVINLAEPPSQIETKYKNFRKLQSDN